MVAWQLSLIDDLIFFRIRSTWMFVVMLAILIVLWVDDTASQLVTMEIHSHPPSQVDSISPSPIFEVHGPVRNIVDRTIYSWVVFFNEKWEIHSEMMEWGGSTFGLDHRRKCIHGPRLPGGDAKRWVRCMKQRKRHKQHVEIPWMRPKHDEAMVLRLSLEFNWIVIWNWCWLMLYQCICVRVLMVLSMVFAAFWVCSPNSAPAGVAVLSKVAQAQPLVFFHFIVHHLIVWHDFVSWYCFIIIHDVAGVSSQGFVIIPTDINRDVYII